MLKSSIEKEVSVKGYSVLSLKSLGFSEKGCEEFDRLTSKDSLDFEFVEIGDTDEPNQVHVSRVGQNRNHCQNAKKIHDMFLSKIFKNISVPNTDLTYERAQVHILYPGNFIGRHSDKESNKNYKFAVVTGFSDNYKGGDFELEGPLRTEAIKLNKKKVLVIDCEYFHQIKKVLSGTRKTLVFFLQKSDKI